MKKIIAFALTMVFILSAFSINAYAQTNSVEITTAEGERMEIIFEDGVSEDFKAKAISHFSGECDEDASTYGLMCTLFGHKIEKSTTVNIVHNARTSAPKCLRRTWLVEACTRCDYTNTTLQTTEYIYCC